MRKLVVCNFMTLDGFYDGPGKDLGSLFRNMHPAHAGSDQFDHHNAGLLRNAGTFLLSHNAFVGNRDYWSGVRGNPDATSIRRQIAQLMADVPKLVPSDRLGPNDFGAWHNTTVVPRHEMRQTIAALRQEQGRDIVVMLSRLLWHDLLAAGLVDELQLMVFPMIAGAGVRMFEPAPEVPLRLLRTEGFPDSGNVLLVYEPANRR